MSEQLRSLRHERDVREHGDAVTTRPWWNAPGEESRVRYSWPDVEVSFFDPNTMTEVKLGPPARKPIRILANPRPFT